MGEARAIDKEAVERYGMPTLLLMENAAIGVAQVARSLGTRFVVLCGPGNNGGDGLAVARHLGRATQIYLLSEPDAVRAKDAATNLGILRAAGYPIRSELDPKELGDGWVWIDALFGIGLERPLAGRAEEWVLAMNSAAGRKLAVDIPSGLHGDTGAALGGLAVRADVTVTFEREKLGLVQESARPWVGRIVVVPLGLP